MKPRYAIYLAPVGTPLWRIGSATIGYDAAAAIELEPSPPPGVDAETWRDWTAEPARYGFHATLKAPFELRPDRREGELVQAADAFAAARRSGVGPGLVVRLIGAFVALAPAAPSAEADALAAAAVEAFEPFRGPLGEADRARRLAAALSPRQAAHLESWGYPYVFDDFRFHMTLTGPLPDGSREPVRAALADRFGEPSLALDTVAIFVQPSRSERFRLLSRHTLGA